MTFLNHILRHTHQALLTVGLMLLCGSGCGYTVGNQYRPEFRTVHVPMFKTGSFRRGFELQLTEAVQKQIQLTGNFRLAKEPGADTRLVGRIVSIDKRVQNQNRLDDPRELELAMTLEVRWEDARTNELLKEDRFPLDSQTVQTLSLASLAPEAGQSLATATQDATNQLARRIVGMMDAPW